MMMTAQRDSRFVIAAGFIGMGLLVLMGQLTGFGGMMSTLWPLAIVVPGLVFLYFASIGGKNQAGLYVPGTTITGAGLILFYQNLTGHWASWAYAWTLFPLFVGIALNLMSKRTGDEGTLKASKILTRIGAVGFILGAGFFELVVFNNRGILGDIALPVLFIAIGVFMLLGNRKSKTAFAGKRKVDDFYPNGKYKNSDRLQQQIDEALAEEDESTPVV